LVVFALSATALLAVVGLLFSFGVVLAERRMLQTAADAASLRGAWAVLTEAQKDDAADAVNRDALVRTQIVTYAASNGVPNAVDVSADYVTGSGAVLTAVGSGDIPFAARGVRVTVRGQSSTVLPGLVGVRNVLVNATSSAAASPAAPLASPVVTETKLIPLAVHVDDMTVAYSTHVQYDLFDPDTAPFDMAPTLDLTSLGAPNSPVQPISTLLQFWSDGQHTNGTAAVGNSVVVAGTEDYNDVAAGLRDNIRRQGRADSTGTFGIFVVPIWSATVGANRVGIIGFARIKVLLADIDADATGARGTFVPYPVAPFGVLTPPSADLGGVLVRILP